ncbi:MAG: TRAP transporter substrate-binding protein [Rhodobacteraceae bacterium]|nr:TRAP transporter substrate-binding protein [Paracoccaceae bacterium]MBR9820858.1 TRAP transporter substrate-binding protein [Paracoccaceae bacterium]
MKKTLLAAVATTALTAPFGASAQEVSLAFSHWLPPVHSLQSTGFEPWIESISEASEGRIGIDIYPAQQLGAAPDHYDMARDGIADITFINPGYQAGRFPIIAAAELPFLVSNGTTASKALHEWYMDYAEQEMPDVKVCLVHLHDPGMLHGTAGPLVAPSDLEGKNVRPPQATIAKMIATAGGSTVQVPVPEMREILSSGAVDITASPWNSLILFGVDDVVTHHLDVPLYSVAFVYAINKGVYEGLSDENRAVIDDHCTPEWSQKIATGWAEVEAGSRADFEGREGHTFYTPDDAQMADWRALSDTIRAGWAEDAAAAGLEDPQAALQELVDGLTEAGGAFGQ